METTVVNDEDSIGNCPIAANSVASESAHCLPVVIPGNYT